jgi:hypothetical protein
MTAVLETFAPSRAVDSLERLVNCSNRYLGSAAWWARLADSLDTLREELAHADIVGLSIQVISDVPELAAAAQRLPDLDDRAQATAALVRMEVADKAGRRTEAIAVREMAKDLIAQVRHVDSLSSTLLHDAYLRDFGGE